MNIEPEFNRMEKEIHSGIMYPVISLDEVEIHCNHDTNKEIAIDNWNRRKRYINYDDLFVEMYTNNRNIAKEFSELEMFTNKVCFIPFEKEYDCEISLKMLPGQKEFWQIVNSSGGNAANSYTYDLIDLLSGKISYRVSV